MRHYGVNVIVMEMEETEESYLEFVRVPSLSVGMYRLLPGETDKQKPHSEDEVYCVISGRAKFTCAGEVRDVGAGSILFVERGVEHRFIDIVEELVVLVMFGPAEGLNA